MSLKHYLCDDNNSQHISFVKGQVLFWCAFEVVPGHTLCALWPRSLREHAGRTLISKQIFTKSLIRHVLLWVLTCTSLFFRGPSYLDLCHGEAVQSSHRWCFLAATIRAGKHTQTYSTYEDKQNLVSVTPLLQRYSLDHKHILRKTVSLWFCRVWAHVNSWQTTSDQTVSVKITCWYRKQN